MTQEWVAILALVALFVVGTVLPINMGALGFVAAWLVGMYSLHLALAGPTGTSASIMNGGSRRTALADRSTAPDGTATAGTGTDTAVRTPVAPRTGGVSADQLITLAAFVAVAVIALVFDKNIGFTAITAAVLLTALFPKAQKGAVSQVAWATVLLVAGVSTFAAILEAAGAPEYVGGWAAGLGAAALGALILPYSGIVVLVGPLLMWAAIVLPSGF